MTAPGNDVVLITLLAAFTAGAGYAAGRLHQWYRTVLDRDEAYRDGYDTATRSVFSLAARLIGPRRAARGTAAVAPAPGGGAGSDPVVVLPPAAPAAITSASVAPPPPGLRPSAFGSRAGSGRSAPSGASGFSAARSAGSSVLSSVVAPSGGSVVSPSAGRPVASSAASAPPSSSSPASSSSSLASSSSLPASPESSGSRPVGSPSSGAAGGRHLVPDELVQAPTYRLTPDRVARAKVRPANPEDDESPETTRLPSVPRPRAS